jgi:predicted type IV restriction endonuclease
MALPKRALERITTGLKKFQPILTQAKTRDVNESDTVTIVADILQEIFGYDKYTEITSEHAIRSTFCDLAVKLDGKLAFLIEAKAVGLELKDQFVKQAVDYASNQGVDWVVLTNGATWRVFRVIFAKPIESELVVDVDLLKLSARSSNDLELLGLLSKEGWQKSHLDEFLAQKEALSRFTIGAMLLTEPLLQSLRRELRRLSPEAKLDLEEIKAVLQSEVIKREVLEGDKADSSRKQIARAMAKAARSKASAAVEQEKQSDNSEGGASNGTTDAT